MAKIVINNIERPDLISEKTQDIILKAADASNNPQITITSGIRTPERQAKAMFDNLEKGIRIRYAAAGQEVVKVYDNCKKIKLSADEIVEQMSAMITKLYPQKVSNHCVPILNYVQTNVLDISKSIPNPRDFVKALLKDAYVTKVITPFDSDYNDKRVSFDSAEPAIHLEIKN